MLCSSSGLSGSNPITPVDRSINGGVAPFCCCCWFHGSSAAADDASEDVSLDSIFSLVVSPAAASPIFYERHLIKFRRFNPLRVVI